MQGSLQLRPSKRLVERAARWVVWALRHAPDEAGIALDAQGFCSVSGLIEAAHRSNHPLDSQTLDAIVAADVKQRLEFSADRLRLRAAQGHSVAVDLSAHRSVPPEVLLHGTATHAIDAIRREGLRPRNRQHVHLSEAMETAAKVGARHGQAVVLSIRAGQMHRAGAVFLRASNGVWLVDAVPPEAIDWEVLFGQKIDQT